MKGEAGAAAGNQGAWRWKRPTLLLSAVAAMALATLIGLGVWQLQRLDWKTQAIARRAERLAAPPVSLAQAQADAQASEYRKLTLSGWLMHGQELIGPAMTHKGKGGVRLITPLAVEDGPVVLVDRGFIPLEKRDPASRPETRPHAPVTVTGFVRLPQQAGGFEPANRPESWIWFRITPDEMLHTLGIRGETRFFLQAAPADKTQASTTADMLPVARAPSVEIANPHLGYALTWFGLAAGLVGVFVAFHLRRASPLASAVVLVAGALAFAALPAQAASTELEPALPEFRVAGDAYCPYNCDPGSPQPGILVELLQQAVASLGGHVRYQLLPWGRVERDVREGRLHAALGPDPESYPQFRYGREAVMFEHDFPFVRKDSTFSYSGPQSLRGLKVAAASQYVFDPQIDKHITIRAGGADPLRLMLSLILSGQAQVLLNAYTPVLYAVGGDFTGSGLRIAGKLYPAYPVHFGFTKQKIYGIEPVMAAVDATIAKAKTDGSLDALLWRYKVDPRLVAGPGATPPAEPIDPAIAGLVVSR